MMRYTIYVCPECRKHTPVGTCGCKGEQVPVPISVVVPGDDAREVLTPAEVELLCTAVKVAYGGAAGPTLTRALEKAVHLAASSPPAGGRQGSSNPRYTNLSEKEVARDAIEQTRRDGDGCYIDNLKPDELREGMRLLIAESSPPAGGPGTTSYLAEVLTDRPGAFFRLDETSGTAAVDAMGGASGTYVGGDPAPAGGEGQDAPREVVVLYPEGGDVPDLIDPPDDRLRAELLAEGHEIVRFREIARSYWQTDEGRLNEAIRRGLCDAGVQGSLAEFVAPIVRRIRAMTPASGGEGRMPREFWVVRGRAPYGSSGWFVVTNADAAASYRSVPEAWEVVYAPELLPPAPDEGDGRAAAMREAECSCASTEASMRRCPVHGEDAPAL